LIRVRPAASHQSGWEVLCGLTPRPLSARAWRVAHMEGTLNSTIAAAMIMLTRPKRTDRFLNLMCGSGTLLIERLLAGKTAYAIGSDLNGRSLEKANLNLAAAKVKATLLQQDDRRLSFPQQSFDVLVADLPWAQLVGSQAQVQVMYPLILGEAARVAMPGARFVMITHQVKLIEALLEEQAEVWRVKNVVKLAYKNLRPRIYMLYRQP
jgi:tRNA (guanine6-N2)-methyltransferase